MEKVPPMVYNTQSGMIECLRSEFGVFSLAFAQWPRVSSFHIGSTQSSSGVFGRSDESRVIVLTNMRTTTHDTKA